MANEVTVGVKVVGASDLKNLTREARKLKAEAIIASAKTKKFDQTMAGLAPTLRKVNSQMKQNVILNQQSMKSSKRLGLLTQQAGYQFQDMAIQIQGGTNAAVAFGQQMSQLAGFFGPSGAMIGLGIALGSALVAPLIRANKEAKDLGDNVKTLMEGYADKIDKLKFGVSDDAELEAAQKLFDLRKIDADLRDQMANTDSLRARLRLSKALKANKVELTAARDISEELENRRKQYDTIVSLAGSEVQEAENMRDAQRQNTAEAVEAANEKKEAEAKYIRDSAIMFLKAQQAVRKANGLEMEEATKKRLEDLEAAEKESIKRRRAVEKTYIVEMSEFFLEVQKRKHEAYMAQFAAEDALMGMDVVKGSTTDRFGEEDLLNMGYTRDYLLEIGKIKEDNAKKVKKYSSYVKELTELEKDRLNLSNTIERQMQNSFMAMVDGTKSVKDAFKSMASDIIKELYRIFVVKKITGMIMGSFGDTSFGRNVGMGNLQGPTQSGAPLANGGFASAGRSYLVGERGPEMFTPTMGGGMVTPASQTNAGGVTIVQNINVSTGVQQTVRAEIKQMMPQIAQSAKGAVLDAKRRGGSYGSAFA